MQFLAAKSRWTKCCSAKCSIPFAASSADNSMSFTSKFCNLNTTLLHFSSDRMWMEELWGLERNEFYLSISPHVCFEVSVAHVMHNDASFIPENRNSQQTQDIRVVEPSHSNSFLDKVLDKRSVMSSWKVQTENSLLVSTVSVTQHDGTDKISKKFEYSAWISFVFSRFVLLADWDFTPGNSEWSMGIELQCDCLGVHLRVLPGILEVLRPLDNITRKRDPPLTILKAISTSSPCFVVIFPEHTTP